MGGNKDRDTKKFICGLNGAECGRQFNCAFAFFISRNTTYKNFCHVAVKALTSRRGSSSGTVEMNKDRTDVLEYKDLNGVVISRVVRGEFK